MTHTPKQISLRSVRSAGKRGEAVRLAAMTVAGLGAMSPALAQGADPIVLPTLEIETPAPRAPAPQPAPVVAQPVAEPAAGAAETPEVAEAPAVEAAPGQSPYTDPAAPYRPVRSANPLLTQPLSETARTVTAIPSDVIEDKNATSIRELARTTPGVTLGTGEGGNAFGDVLFVRGFKSSNDMFIDGQRNAGVSVNETFMAEQAEITKGPSGSIAGRGTTGGAVNLVTKKPQDQDFLHSRTTLGTHVARQTLDWNKVWSDDLRTRANIMVQEGEVAGRDSSEDDRWGVSIAGEKDVNDKLTLSLEAFHTEFNGMPDWGVPWDGTNGVPFTEDADGRPTVDRDTFYGVTDRDFHRAVQDVATFGLSYDFDGGAVLNNRLRYSRSINDYVLTAPERPDTSDADPDNWTITASPKSRYQVTETIANQTTLSFDPRLLGMDHAMVAGVEYAIERIDQSSYNGLTSEVGGGTAEDRLAGCSVSIFDPDTSDCFDSDTTDLIRTDPNQTDVETISLYFTDTFQPVDRLSVNLGLRLDSYDIEKQGEGRNGAYAYDQYDLLFNWNAGLTYKLSEHGTVYLAYATSSNPMGQELDAGGGSYGGLDEAGQELDPEENTSLEIGTKWVINDNLLLTAAAFRTTKDNARESQGRGADAVTTDTGRYEVEGYEFGFAGNVTERLAIHGGATFMDSRVTDSVDEESEGLQLANIAHEQFNLLADYQLTDAFSVGGQATWRGKIQGGTLAATTEAEIPAYWRFDLMASYQVSDKLTLSGRIDNVTDELYYDALYRSGEPFVYVAPGRSASISIDYAF